MVNIARNAFRHIISAIFRKLSQYTRVMGRFSDVVRYDLIITDRMGRLPMLMGSDWREVHVNNLSLRNDSDTGEIP